MSVNYLIISKDKLYICRKYAISLLKLFTHLWKINSVITGTIFIFDILPGEENNYENSGETVNKNINVKQT